MTLKLRSAAVSDRGLVRSGNEDAVHAGEWLVAVADGMGGMAAGDLASALAIGALAALDGPLPDDRLAESLRQAVETASARIRAAVAEDPTRQGMGTTLTALLLSATGTAVALVHVGDSRAYRLRGGMLEQMTKDDTFVQMLVDEGVITEEQAMTHPRRAVITRALQGDPVTVAYAATTPEVGDRWLLCSDGLSSVVPISAISEVLGSQPDPLVCAQRLVDLALAEGGPDNVTVAIADVVEVP
ncbi:MAG TPA: protein phosphatase 2C domain-containing protein [Micromonospora sp.]